MAIQVEARHISLSPGGKFKTRETSISFICLWAAESVSAGPTGAPNPGNHQGHMSFYRIPHGNTGENTNMVKLKKENDIKHRYM